MLSALSVVLPIFALILFGWLARRFEMLGPAATGELNRFVLTLSLPALLFDIVARARFHDIWLPGFSAAYGLSCLAVYGLTLAVSLKTGQRLADAAIDGLNAGFPNAGFMGLPLALAAFGPAALAPTTVAIVFTACVTFALAIVLIEIGLQSKARRGRLAPRVLGTLVRNPLLIGPALGAMVSASGLVVPDAAETFLKLLGGAASPCALVALGLFLGEKAVGHAGQGRAAALLVATKLVLQPAVAFGLAALFGLSPPLTHVLVLLAGLPTGAGSFMLAEFYQRDARLTSNVILASTILSIVTIAAYLYLIA